MFPTSPIIHTKCQYCHSGRSAAIPGTLGTEGREEWPTSTKIGPDTMAREAKTMCPFQLMHRWVWTSKKRCYTQWMIMENTTGATRKIFQLKASRKWKSQFIKKFKMTPKRYKAMISSKTGIAEIIKVSMILIARAGWETTWPKAVCPIRKKMRLSWRFRQSRSLTCSWRSR